jgi:hypothetical protein
MFHPKRKSSMSAKSKHGKPRAKTPKPNLHGPNSPTPKKRSKVYDEEDHEAEKTNHGRRYYEEEESE